MSIKIKSIKLDKDVVRKHFVSDVMISNTTNKLEGRLLLKLKVGNVTGDSEIELGSISEQLQDELYLVLSKIEDELNEIEKENL